MKWKESFLQQVGTNAGESVIAVNATLGYAEGVAAGQTKTSPQGLSTAISKMTPVGSKRFGWGPTSSS